MGLCRGLFKCFFYSIRNILFIFLLVVIMPGLPPKPYFHFQSFSITKTRELKGALESNNLLNNAERLFEGALHGPECLVARGNEIFASVNGGEIVKLSGNHVTHVTKIGQPCEGPHEEETCGRPLGFAFDTIQQNTIIVADAYYGLWEIDLTNSRKKILVSPHQELDGKLVRKAKIFNSVAISKMGDIYWSDSSSDYTLDNGFTSMFANPSGRLFKYDRNKNTNTILIDEIYFANGVALHPTEEFVLVAETGGSAIRRYYLKGPLAGTSDVFVDGLPGAPDNLTPDSDGIWVPLVHAIDDENLSMFHITATVPLIRKFICRSFDIIALPFRLVHSIFPNSFTKKIIHNIGHFEPLIFLAPKRVTILRIDWNGNIVGSLHGFDKSIGHIAHVLELNEQLYLGSFTNKYVGRVKLPKGSSGRVKKQDTEQVKPTTTTTTTTTTTPKPTTTTTTTTPKPTTTTTTTTPRPTTTSTTTTTTTTTTPKPITTTTTPKPATTKKPETAPTTEKPIPKPTENPTKPPVASTRQPPPPPPPTPTTSRPKEPAPIHEYNPKDTKPPPPEKLKIIKKDGEHGEL